MSLHSWISDFPEQESLAGAVPWQPEDHDVFRLAQLVLLLDVAAEVKKPVVTLERLGYYDFFSASPFVVMGKDSQRDSEDRLALKLAGFVESQLSYASTGQRWVSRRRRLQHDLALLLSYGLVSLHDETIGLTTAGRDLANQLSTVYADAYRVSAAVVIRRLSRLSDRALSESVQRWLGASWLTIDLLDDVTPESVRIDDGADD
jgi:hypothetical protein